MKTTFLQKLTRYREICSLSRDEVGAKLGVTGRYIGMIERGEKSVTDDSAMARLLDMLIKDAERNFVSEGVTPYKFEPRSNARIIGPAEDIFVGTIPVISWAHAGAATSYEELPAHWQERIPTMCRGKRAFGLVIEGDSMMPRCEPGDIVNVDPDLEPRNGCLVVVKLKNDGVMLRRFTRLSDTRVKLIAYNTLYPSTEHELKEFHWIYPVHSTFRRENLS
jgi:SOS-response transcriptional repressor LexA